MNRWVTWLGVAVLLAGCGAGEVGEMADAAGETRDAGSSAPMQDAGTAQPFDAGHRFDAGQSTPFDAGTFTFDAGEAPGDAGTTTQTFTCTHHVTPSTFAVAFTAAGANAVLCLAPGTYGAFSGAAKSARVVITPDTAAGAKPPVGNATGGVNGNVFFNATFSNAAFITLDGLTFKNDVRLTGTSHDLTIQNSLFRSHLFIDDTAMQNANIVIDFNSFPADLADCINGYEGRIQLTNSGHAAVPDGVSIQNNDIGGVASVQCDGIQSGGHGPHFIGNYVHDFHYAGAAHTDGIQLYGSQATVIKGNFFYNVPDGVVAYDGMHGEDIENNVFVNDSRNNNGASPNQFNLLANSGATTVKHNTIVGGLDAYGGTEGNLTLGTKGDPCSGLTIRDNVATSISNGSGGGTCTFSSDYNLLHDGGGTGAHEVHGAPIYVGGDCGNLTVDPPGKCGAKWSNFMLAANSPGHGAAEDGTDLGAYGPGPVTPGN